MNDVKKFTKGKVAFPQKEEAMAFGECGDLPITNIMIGVTYPYSDYSIYRKGSSFFVFEHVLEGQGELIINNEKHSVTAGDTYIILPSDEVFYRSNPTFPMKKYWINFECDYMDNVIKSYKLKSGVYKTDTKSIFENLLYVSKSQKPFYEIYSIIAECLNSIVIRSALAMRAENNTDAFYIRQQLLSYVYKKPQLEEISKSLNMSKTNVIRIFKKHYGITPYDFIINAKMDAAKLLLINTAMSIKEIAEQVKISDEHYFSTLFTKKVGVRPTQFRKNHKNK